MMKILLHACCAPCMLYPLKRLREKGFEVEGYFYNPNIHPCLEYHRRKAALEHLRRQLACVIEYPEYRPSEYFRETGALEHSPERCLVCWELRLRQTAKRAKEKGAKAFTTTLLVSPYQDQEALQRIGQAVGAEEGVAFLHEDFRSGFRAAHEEAKRQGVYCQNYCGCIYSEIERHARKKKK